MHTVQKRLRVCTNGKEGEDSRLAVAYLNVSFGDELAQHLVVDFF